MHLKVVGCSYSASQISMMRAFHAQHQVSCGSWSQGLPWYYLCGPYSCVMSEGGAAWTVALLLTFCIPKAIIIDIAGMSLCSSWLCCWGIASTTSSPSLVSPRHSYSCKPHIACTPCAAHAACVQLLTQHGSQADCCECAGSIGFAPLTVFLPVRTFLPPCSVALLLCTS